ncbi:carbamoyl phosphate synthase small subunit [Bacillus alkalicellulosilyticus]|uniref:carbamoyl phosphate synthase small subunit n=1 Tax=Alkalihalobacterium alkalicellulosilyticum TaxID=1912214 RepID=UPI0009966298|nr:carbamoyl phosphate synthase small subunit [Bacillus alkalicellulosilyticus]
MKRQLIMEDGTVFVGKAFGSDIEKSGEVVFNTGMTGYQEILSDLSYCGQIVTLTYPLIGNYGINRDDFESIEPAIHGLIVKEVAKYPSNWRSEESLDALLKFKGIPGLEGIDTRKLTRLIRQHGTLKGRLCNMEVNVDKVVKELNDMPLMTDQVNHVSTKDPYHAPGRKYRIVLVDFGAKHGILRNLIHYDSDVIVVPYNASLEEVLGLNPDGIMLSNGPGDPTDVQEGIELIKGLIGKVPTFGICLGHQLIALACGAKTDKLKFGHRGSNHPVKELETGKIDITSQNHGYAVVEDSLKDTRLKVTHVSVNDGTVEGLEHLDHPVFCVQYHPEASPGPEDSIHLFDKFINMIEEHKNGKVKA